jgi:uncharacterized protein (DUF2062 family)
VKPLLARARARLLAAVGVDQPASRVAAAWALGIGIGLCPLIGLHTVIAIALAFAFRLSKLDVVLGTLIANPWTLSVYFPGAVFLGERVTGVRIPHIKMPTPETLFHPSLWRGNAQWIRTVLLAWGVGATICAVLGGLSTYLVLKWGIERHRRRHPHLARSGAAAAQKQSAADTSVES